MRTSRRKRLLAAAAIVGWAVPVVFQAQDSRSPEPSGIQDNSFLVEEAYNQEPGVVQHIQMFERTRNGSWVYSFTQEWPVPGQNHQLSFIAPLVRALSSSGWNEGPGDVAINYRYQLLGDGEARVAVSPRLTVLLPTGSERHGLGAGGTSLQLSLPVSTVLFPWLVAHWNAGLTYVHSARNEEGQSAPTRTWNFGQSFVWLTRSDLNFLVETVWTRAETVASPGRTSRSRAFLVSPGIRWAWNRPEGVQIVPGIAFPLGVGPSRGERSVLLYFSVEHPFQKSSPR
ncbi:MAG: transporter [Acidobacteriota bacterium]